MPKGRNAPFFITKILHFEFWPYWLFYFPMYFYGIYLALKSRSAMYFSTANPGMKCSGVVGESKYKVLQSLPAAYTPKTLLIPSSIPYSSILKMISDYGFSYPFVVKPDVGERGAHVEVIRNESYLKAYLKGKSFDLNIQEYLDHPLEFGILYHRLPEEKSGHITSMVQKGFLYVTGDGQQTLHHLMKKEIRISNRIPYFEDKFRDQLDHVLLMNEKMYLEPIGNHCRGTTFYDACNLINDQLVKLFDEIALQVEGYYYGRFDVKVASTADLYRGENMKIIELNGVSSEVAHIYDPDYNLIRAYGDVFRHMKYIYEIAKLNHEKGVEYYPLRKFLKELVQHLRNK
jgi:hypothetical protein